MHWRLLSSLVRHWNPLTSSVKQGVARTESTKRRHISVICICPQVSDILDLHNIKEKFSTYQSLLALLGGQGAGRRAIRRAREEKVQGGQGGGRRVSRKASRTVHQGKA